MKSLSRVLSAAGLALGLALSGAPAGAQQPAKSGAPAAGQPQPLKAGSPAAMAAAREILTMKNASAMYASAIPNIVQQVKENLLQSNLNLQKDLNEAAVTVAQGLAGRDKEIGEGMAQVYTSEFTEQELKDLVTFYKTPLGQKLLTTEPRAIQLSMSYMNQWAQAFGQEVNTALRNEMRKRGKPM